MADTERNGRRLERRRPLQCAVKGGTVRIRMKRHPDDETRERARVPGLWIPYQEREPARSCHLSWQTVLRKAVWWFVREWLQRSYVYCDLPCPVPPKATSSLRKTLQLSIRLRGRNCSLRNRKNQKRREELSPKEKCMGLCLCCLPVEPGWPFCIPSVGRHYPPAGR